MEKAVVTVVGKDMVGILAKVAAACADCNANVLEVTQNVLQDMFAMFMVVDISALNMAFPAFADRLAETGREIGMDIRAMHEDIFNSMHRV